MDWIEARRKLLQLAKGSRPLLGDERTGTGGGLVPAGSERASFLLPDEKPGVSLCVGSGKGGTGKSVVTASLAKLCSLRGRTLIVDADLGVGNAHILQDVAPSTTFVDVIEGRKSVQEVVCACTDELDLLAAGSGVPRMADLSGYELHLIAAGLERIDSSYAYVVIDSAAGISRQTIAFAQVADCVLIVTTPDLTAMTDAYAFLKVLVTRRPGVRPLLLVNRASGEDEAFEVSQRIARVSERFLDRAPRMIGWVPEDPVVTQCSNRRGPVVELEPHAPFSFALRRVAAAVLDELRLQEPTGVGRMLSKELAFASENSSRRDR